LQSYAGTASPFNFNGLVRHTYLRGESWHGDIQVQLMHKEDRDQTSHDLAVAAREALLPIATKLGAKIEVIEMPPGPPVLQTVVAEVYGPDAETRRQVARDLEAMFEEAETIVDADSYLQAPYESWRFVVAREKASRRGISVEDINRQLEMAMGDFKLGDVKMERSLEPRFIILQMPLSLRSQFGRLGQLPIPTANGTMIPLTELGRFEPFLMDDPVYHKDLRAVEYVTGEVAGRLGAPIYALFEVEDLLDGYISPDGVRVGTNYTGPPADSLQSSLEWTGEWTVTYVTFRDMGIAFGIALIMIYILVVWEFGNFTTPAIVMAPIPLTLIGIVPGHWLLGAPFTATSMIGFIALAGIIVRNSILLVDFARIQVESGMEVKEAVISACATRTRPIIITAMALVAGSFVILSDPIFQGMAISLMFGGMVSTLLTLIVIPLGCVSFRAALIEGDTDGDDGGSTPAATGSDTATVSTNAKSSGVVSGIVDAVVMVGEVALFLVVGTVTGAFRWIKALFTRSKVEAPVVSAPVVTPKAEVTPAVVPTPVKAAPKPKAKPAPKAATKPAVKRKAKAAPKAAAKPSRKPAAKPAAKRTVTRSAATRKPRRGIRLNTSINDTQE